MNKRYEFYWSVSVPGLLALTFDQATKYFSPAYVLNQNVSFSLPFMPADATLQTLLLAILLIGISLFARWHMRNRPHILMNVSYSVLLGAALSNWLDRVMYSGVRDIWEISGLGLHNNLADWLIVLSVAVIIGVDALQQSRQK